MTTSKVTLNSPWLEKADAATHEEIVHKEIAALAHSLWQARGCPEGSPEVDWLQAEQYYQQSLDSTSLKVMAAEA